MIFLNLTNGLLWTQSHKFDGFIRIQSCYCEQKLWGRVILDLDNNFLMWLALGKPLTVVDYSARKMVPRALYQGLEYIWFSCCKVWKLPVEKVIVRGNDCTKYFEEEFSKLDQHAVKKLKYYRKFLNNPQKPQIISGPTDKDGDYEFFVKLAKNL